jgi:anti-sigma factor NepR-like protein
MVFIGAGASPSRPSPNLLTRSCDLYDRPMQAIRPTARNFHFRRFYKGSECKIPDGPTVELAGGSHVRQRENLWGAMPDRADILPQDHRVWMLAIGRRLRADYDAVAEPVPERLARLIKQLEPAESRRVSTIQPPLPPPAVTISRFDPDGHRPSPAQQMKPTVRTPSYASGAPRLSRSTVARPDQYAFRFGPSTKCIDSLLLPPFAVRASKPS